MRDDHCEQWRMDEPYRSACGVAFMPRLVLTNIGNTTLAAKEKISELSRHV
jgi:hypothetical protein